MTKPSSLLEELVAVVGADGIVDGEPRQRLLVDERGQYHGRAAAVVQPRTTAEISAIVRVCAARGLGIVPQGGNTGYCGGATADGSGTQVVVNLSRLDRVHGVDTRNATMTLDAGVTLADAQAAAAAHDLLLPLSMGSESSCQVGGNVSTNAGGLAVLRYGTCRDLVAGLEVVLADGRIWRDMEGLRKDNTGYDLKQVFIGAEGTLGIVTQVVLRLFPRPRARLTAWLGVATVAAALEVLVRLRGALGDCVTSMEFISRDALDLALRQIPELASPLPGFAGHHALVELAAFDDGSHQRAAAETVLATALDEAVIEDAVIAQSETQRRDMWALRERLPEAERRAGGSVKHDVSVSLSRLDAFEHACRADVSGAFPGAPVSVYGHVGDGNLHFNVLAPRDMEFVGFRRDHGEHVSSIVHAAALAHGGSFSAEHGIGQLKRDLLARTCSPVALDMMRGIKHALDPHGRMNPGKVL